MLSEATLLTPPQDLAMLQVLAALGVASLESPRRCNFLPPEAGVLDLSLRLLPFTGLLGSLRRRGFFSPPEAWLLESALRLRLRRIFCPPEDWLLEHSLRSFSFPPEARLLDLESPL